MTDAKAHKKEIERRRTFAIISHPDAGKTTLTEKLLLLGGVIQLAGAVKAKRGHANAVSDWMKMEQERGISITTSVMQFPYKGLEMNLLDTPGHADFSEDTYRTLHAVDAAIMLLDSAKGVEAQTKKLFRVCKHRAIPIFTFVNKMDRPGRDPFDLVGEVENVLGIEVYPITWPVYTHGSFCGVYHRLEQKVYLFDPEEAGSSINSGAEIKKFEILDRDDPALKQKLDQAGFARFQEDIELLDIAGDSFDHELFVAGEISPMFFGSAINNFGLDPFLESFCKLAPSPGVHESSAGPIEATQDEFSGFIFKIQANMNKAHRDRLAFVRINSGRFERGMKILHVRSGRELRLANPTLFLAQERSLAEEAYAGDIIGVFDSGLFEIGDTLSEGSRFQFEKIPSFAPEHFSRLISLDPMRRKQLTRGIEQLAQEGTVQLYRPPSGLAGEMILGAVGELQMEVVKYRLQGEYGVKVRMEPQPYQMARWVSRKDAQVVDLEQVRKACPGLVVLDLRERPVVLFERPWSVRLAQERLEDHLFAETAQGVVVRDGD